MSTPPIVCFEGPSGVGKTTLAHLLSTTYSTVPEVNLLFERPSLASAYWYHERQVERFQRCRQAPQVSILDGDVFQPIWYNWVCGYPSHFLPQEATHQFYRNAILEGRLAFPDLYFIFHIDEKELRARKERDATRQRRNFEKHLRIIEPLKAYYQFLDQETDLEMRFITYTDVQTAQEQVLASLHSIEPKPVDSLQVFEQIEAWIRQH